tara:strand:- start:7264 stop:7527 length:264 start_codon:yes stop_codon:yes gene_type:complete
MINSIIYGLLASFFLVLITRICVLLSKRFEKISMGLAYGSLGAKLFFLGIFTVVIKGEIENSIVYATIILMSIIYCNAYTFLALTKK